MPSVGSLDGELLKALLEESYLPRATRGVANKLVTQLEETLSGTTTLSVSHAGSSFCNGAHKHGGLPFSPALATEIAKLYNNEDQTYPASPVVCVR